MVVSTWALLSLPLEIHIHLSDTIIHQDYIRIIGAGIHRWIIIYRPPR